MAHKTGRSEYGNLIDRYNKFPQGLAESDSLYQILQVLFTKEEAELVSKLPIKPFNVKLAMKIWNKSEEETSNILENFASKALLLDMNNRDEQIYVLPPPMIGFFEFTLMRTGGEFDQKLLSELYHQYLEEEDDFMVKLLTLKTPVGRILVNETSIKDEDSVYVLDYEKATSIIKNSESMGVSRCYCRHKAEHLGEACDAPQEVCLSVNNLSHSLSKHGYARLISKEEALNILETSYNHNLVQFAENVKNDVGFICNCCSCCCVALKGFRRMGIPNTLSSSNFIPLVKDKCIGCGKCVSPCPAGCLSIDKDNKKVILDSEMCLGCGVCSRVCPVDAMDMTLREKKVFTPVNTVHKLVLEAIESDTLQNLIFDNQAMFNHRFMAAFSGAFLKLSPVKKLLVSETFQSKFLMKIIEKYEM